MAISKKIRFEVFKRDGFRCAYCGKTPPEVMLEVDHIDPKSKGGEDDINNLITACFDCNRGKRNILLDKIPNQMNDNLEILQSKELQLKEYRKYIKKIEKRLNNNMDEIEDIFKKNYPNIGFTDQFKNATLKNFLNKFLTFEEVKEAMYIACSFKNKEGEEEDCIRYFCGVCWRKIRNRGVKV
jgi:CRISPR/Cas system Type II protein with McrA/HNH and RuvC-like nuclease domain